MEYMPCLREVSGIRVWTGFRAATADKLPLIGPTEKTWLHLAMGFEGLGITNAPGAARLAADHLLGQAFRHRCDTLSADAHRKPGGDACLMPELSGYA